MDQRTIDTIIWLIVVAILAGLAACGLAHWFLLTGG